MHFDLQSIWTTLCTAVTAVITISHIFQNKATKAATDAHIATLKDHIATILPIANQVASLVEKVAPKTAPAIEEAKKVEQAITPNQVGIPNPPAA